MVPQRPPLSGYISFHKKDRDIMNIYINNKQTETAARSLTELATELNLPERGVAMAVGTQMVLREQWDDTKLSDGDSVIIIKAACGG